MTLKLKLKLINEYLLLLSINNFLESNGRWDCIFIGFEVKIPGFPRYEMVVDKKIGMYNLSIKNVSLEDEASFECQIGPKILANERFAANRTSVNLIVMGK